MRKVSYVTNSKEKRSHAKFQTFTLVAVCLPFAFNNIDIVLIISNYDCRLPNAFANTPWNSKLYMCNFRTLFEPIAREWKKKKKQLFFSVFFLLPFRISMYKWHLFLHFFFFFFFLWRTNGKGHHHTSKKYLLLRIPYVHIVVAAVASTYIEFHFSSFTFASFSFIFLRYKNAK